MSPIRIAVIGLGAMGRSHARTILTEVPEAKLTAVVSAHPGAAEELRAIPGGEEARVFATPEALFEARAADAVIISSVHRLHARQAIAAFRAGLHVLLEKPVGVTTEEAAAVEAAADRAGLAYGVMFNVRTHPLWRTMKRLVDSGELGEIRRTSYIVTDWFRAQSYYDSAAWRATWRADGGGVLLNQAPHSLDVFQWICGMPVRLRAFCGFGRWHDIEVEDDVSCFLEYANGATGTFVTSTGETPGTNRLEIALDGGRVLAENGRLSVTRLSQGCTEYIRTFPGGYGQPEAATEEIVPEGKAGMHGEVIRAFVSHILRGTPLVADGREGMASLQLACGMILSGWTGETVSLPVDGEKYARLLEARAAKSPEKTAKPVVMDLSKSYQK